jgi:hypothetical protein
MSGNILNLRNVVLVPDASFHHISGELRRRTNIDHASENKYGESLMNKERCNYLKTEQSYRQASNLTRLSFD